MTQRFDWRAPHLVPTAWLGPRTSGAELLRGIEQGTERFMEVGECFARLLQMSKINTSVNQEVQENITYTSTEKSEKLFRSKMLLIIIQTIFEMAYSMQAHNCQIRILMLPYHR